MAKKKNALTQEEINKLIKEFEKNCQPIEKNPDILIDNCTKAQYCECHIVAEKLISLGTIDVPLDPEDQQEYRANRAVVEDHFAYGKMQEDALNRRSFSNIVAEYTCTFDPAHPLKVIGGQHRYLAIKNALAKDVNELHGIKLYFGLDTEQRLDVQLISNTNIAVSTDLLDRMLETTSGPELRNWCQEAGLLLEGKDFSDVRKHGQLVTVKAARTFIMNYFLGEKVDPEKIDTTETIPVLAETGSDNRDWVDFKNLNSHWWQDGGLKKAGKEFAELCSAQHRHFSSRGKGFNVDYAEKALNYAIISSWAFIAGMLHKNAVRLERHFNLRKVTAGDPLNAAALADGKHKTDPPNYRGLGYRTGPKERGRFVELFYLNAEKGFGITKGLVDAAIKKFHAKQAVLEAQEAESRVSENGNS